MQEGRALMYAAGVELGDRLRTQLKVSGEGDLIAAARLLYRLLGIDFEVEREGDVARLIVRRCCLSEGYSPLTCEVISAMDEGVVEGLDPSARMAFITRNTACPRKCEADIKWEGSR